jgi:LmbE family N-acetylglucosaminyl deacetylase
MLDLIIIVPHPDDEAALCGGLIARAVAKKAKVKVVFVTSGVHGRTLGLVEQKALASERRKEAKGAAAALGLKDILFLGYDDYDPRGKKTFDWPKVGEKLASRLRGVSVRTVIVSFPPNGLNGHPDHMRASRLARELAAEHGAAMLYATSAAAGKSLGTTRYIGAQRRRKLHRDPTHILRLSEAEVQKKIWALSCYRTQALSMVDYMRHAEGNLFEEHFSLADGGQGAAKFLSGVMKLSAARK